MDHVVLPLPADHLAALAALAEGLEAATGVTGRASTSQPHLTLIAFTGLEQPLAVDAVTSAVASIAPFVLHAHGYGLFTGDDPGDLSLYVPVVRAPQLDALHASVHDALRAAGARVAAWTGRDLWSPHITVLNRGLDPVTIGAGVTWLARRHHPSWHIPVDRLLVTGGWSERDRACATVWLGVTAVTTF